MYVVSAKVTNVVCEADFASDCNFKLRSPPIGVHIPKRCRIGLSLPVKLRGCFVLTARQRLCSRASEYMLATNLSACRPDGGSALGTERTRSDDSRVRQHISSTSAAPLAATLEARPIYSAGSKRLVFPLPTSSGHGGAESHLRSGHQLPLKSTFL